MNPSDQPTILIVDDDTVLAGMLCEFLRAEGCECLHAVAGEDALRQIKNTAIDLAILDIMMPGIGGIETLRRIRAEYALPVIMLTARGDDLDRILGLELGADDYLPKPCNPRELLARIRAVLRRVNPADEERALPVSVGDLTLAPATRSASVAGEEIELTQTEFDLLILLARNAGQLVSKNEISRKVLGKPLSQWDRSIDVHVSNLRKKIRRVQDGDERIRTLRGSGYLLQATEMPA